MDYKAAKKVLGIMNRPSLYTWLIVIVANTTLSTLFMGVSTGDKQSAAAQIFNMVALIVIGVSVISMLVLLIVMVAIGIDYLLSFGLSRVSIFKAITRFMVLLVGGCAAIITIARFIAGRLGNSQQIDYFGQWVAGMNFLSLLQLFYYIFALLFVVLAVSTCILLLGRCYGIGYLIGSGCILGSGMILFANEVILFIKVGYGAMLVYSILAVTSIVVMWVNYKLMSRMEIIE